jgi:hypothetical protein
MYPSSAAYSLQLPNIVQFWDLATCDTVELTSLVDSLKKEKVLGFDLEQNEVASSERQRPSGRGGGMVALFIVAMQTEVHLFHVATVKQVIALEPCCLYHACSILPSCLAQLPAALVELLTEKNVTFVGHHIKGDRTRARNDFLHPGLLPTIEDTMDIADEVVASAEFEQC